MSASMERKEVRKEDMKEEDFESIGDYVKHLEYKLKIAKLKAELTKMEDKMNRHQDKKYKRGDKKLNDSDSTSGKGGESSINSVDEDKTILNYGVNSTNNTDNISNDMRRMFILHQQLVQKLLATVPTADTPLHLLPVQCPTYPATVST